MYGQQDRYNILLGVHKWPQTQQQKTECTKGTHGGKKLNEEAIRKINTTDMISLFLIDMCK